MSDITSKHTLERSQTSTKWNKRIYSAITPSNRAQCSSRPTWCTPCNKSFTQACKMTEHLFIQSGEKPPCCGECKKSFSQTETLSRHILICHSLRSYHHTRPMKVKVVKWCRKKWNKPNLMYIYHKQSEIMQKVAACCLKSGQILRFLLAKWRR